MCSQPARILRNTSSTQAVYRRVCASQDKQNQQTALCISGVFFLICRKRILKYHLDEFRV
jgi:hypothetical protein